MATAISANTNGFSESTIQELQRTVERIGQGLAQGATVRAAFGEPCVVGERTMIPVAQVRYSFAGGGGGGGTTGTSVSPTESAAAIPNATGFGGGTAGTLTVRPVAVIEVTSERLRVRPVADVQAIITRSFAFALIATLVALIVGIGRTRRRIGLRIGNIGRVASPQLVIGGPRVSCGPRTMRR